MQSGILDYLYKTFPFYERQGKNGYKPGLSNSMLLDEHFEHPHRAYKTIHVAGTNGKGSTSHMLASILQEQGYKVGLYTSPHLVEFNERIRVNGKKIENEFISQFVDKHKEYIESLSPSFFEVTTALAFVYFKTQNVDIAVIEVGLGGRLDCTNIIHPIVSIITNISYDHKDILGNTLTEIATEKAGIIKHKTTVVIGESLPETELVFRKIAEEKESPIFFADKDIEMKITNLPSFRLFEILNGNMEGFYYSKLLGDYQINNFKTVIKAVEILKECIVLDAISVKKGIRCVCKNTGINGRWQKIASKPLIYCDVAHNEAGIALVMQQINKINKKKKHVVHIIWGMVNDKDIAGIITCMPSDAKYYLTQPSVERAMDVSDLAKCFEKAGFSYVLCENVSSAIKKAKENATLNDLIFIGGSTFTVADAFKNEKFSKKLLHI